MQSQPEHHRKTISPVVAGRSSQLPARSILACVIVAALAAVVSPSQAHAQSAEQLQRENAQLKAEIARLRQAAGLPPEVGTTAPPSAAA